MKETIDRCHPVASKVLETILYNQMHRYLEQNNLIYAFQSGFRSAHSTDTALTFLADKLRANMDEGLYTGMVLIDLQKAFDTVDYTILTTKLNAIGIRRFRRFVVQVLSDREKTSS